MSMTPERYEQVRNVFIDVCELDESRRGEALDARCAGDSELRHEVESLLAEERHQTEHPLRESRLGIMADVMHAIAEGDGETLTMLGKYRVIRKLGAGGMGAVYEAEQDHPRRTVALKVMRSGMARDDMLKRFAHEAHVLGLLQHPGIAQIYDAGTAEISGEVQPFFVMELVRGEALTSYAQSRNLSTHSRLEIMVRVAEAVHHAHTKGVVHRDLKPGNILVVEGNGEAGSAKHVQPKILDFGVARATDSDVMTTTLHTDIGQLIGTVPYMSPEQASGDSDQIDTRSDVYSLGVVCYELLSHRLPHDLKRVKVHEAARVIREDDSVKLSSINRAFRGDVETIIGKALEKDKERRYQSASDFAADIRRYLNDEPIQARPASAMYQARKFAQRNRALVGGAIAVMLVLIAGIVTTTHWLLSAHAAAELAATRLTIATAAQQEAVTQAAVAGAVRNFLADLLKSADPAIAQGSSLTVVEILDDATSNLQRTTAMPTEVAGEVHDILGVSYHGLGRLEPALEHLRAAVAMRREHLGSNDVHTLESMQNLAAVLADSGATDEALQYCDEALKSTSEQTGPGDPRVLSLISLRGTIMHDRNDLNEAERLYTRALEGRRTVLGEHHKSTLTSYHNLASVLADKGDYDGAEQLYRTSLERASALLGADHPDTLFTLRNLGNCLRRAKKLREAEPVLYEAMERSQRVLGNRHHLTGTAIMNLGTVYQELGRLPEAEHLFRQALEIATQSLARGHRKHIAALTSVAWSLDAQRKYEDAEPLYLEAIELHRENYGNKDPSMLRMLNNLAMMYSSMERYADADPLLREVVEARREALGMRNMDTLNAISNLALNLRRDGQPDAAMPLYDEVASNADSVASAADWRPDAWRAARARCLVDLKQFEQAEALYLAALAGLQSKVGEQNPRTIQVVQALVELYDTWDRPEEAATYRAMLPEPTSKSSP